MFTCLMSLGSFFQSIAGLDHAAQLSFVVGADGGDKLISYRMRDNHYIVDRLFAAVTLRLGTVPR